MYQQSTGISTGRTCKLHTGRPQLGFEAEAFLLWCNSVPQYHVTLLKRMVGINIHISAELTKQTCIRLEEVKVHKISLKNNTVLIIFPPFWLQALWEGTKKCLRRRNATRVLSYSVVIGPILHTEHKKITFKRSPNVNDKGQNLLCFCEKQMQFKVQPNLIWGFSSVFSTNQVGPRQYFWHVLPLCVMCTA